MEANNFLNRPSEGEQGLIAGHGFCTKAGVQFLIQVLIGLIQVKYQNTHASPFDTHGLIMLLFILALLGKVYAKYLLEISQTSPNTSYLPITKLVAQISGVVACGLLLSILLPPLWWWIILFPCALNSIRELLRSFREISESLHEIYQQTRIYEWLQGIYQKISESLHIIYQQIYEWLHGIYQRISGILGRVFKKLYDVFQWLFNPTQYAGTRAFNENSVKQEGEGGCPRVQIV